MSFSTVGLSVHEDDKHSGSAKRNAANGVAPLGADSKVPDANSQVPSTHPSATTGVHGVGASTVASAADISAHSALTTGAHGAGANTIENTGNKNAANGYAGLNASSKIATSQLDTGTNANQIVKLDASAKLPTVDGSALINISSGEGHITIMPHAYSSITQGTFVINVDTLNALAWEVTNSSTTQNDQINYMVFLAPGTYTLSILSLTHPSNAIITALINGASIGTVDAYSAATVRNQVLSISGIVVATPGLKTLSLKAATRNASATAWNIRPQIISMYRTA